MYFFFGVFCRGGISLDVRVSYENRVTDNFRSRVDRSY